jgi:hypothetical protein
MVLTALSYIGMLACALISATTAHRFDLPFYYLLVSFLSYYLSITVLTYQSQRWHELLSGALLDIGSLSLILAILALLLSAPYPATYQVALSVTAFLVWYLDHLIRTALTARVLSRAEDNNTEAQHQQQEDVLRRTAVGDTLWYLLKGYKSE